MEDFRGLELLSRGLGKACSAVTDCTGPFQDLPLLSNGGAVEASKEKGTPVPYVQSTECSQPPCSGLARNPFDSAALELLESGDITSRPTSAPPNLGSISASTLFAYPPLESAGCIDFLLGDIRYDAQYCEFYR